MNHFTIIGISDSPNPFIPQEAKEAIKSAKVFSGGIRHHAIVKDILPDGAAWIDITVPIDNVFTEYAKHEDENIVVFASGDPLFFGFANTVRRHLPNAPIHLFPTFNSLQALAHRLLMEYDDMRIVSLTGRPWFEFDRALIEGTEKIGVLTDREHTPQAIAERMIEYGYDNYEMFVGERLGNPAEEKIVRSTFSFVGCGEIGSFSSPNCLILKATRKRERRFGLPNDEFMLLDGRKRMITKMPIRLLTLQALELCHRNVLWDIGFCTGSISIEARMQFPCVHVVAFEIREEGKELIETNARHFGTPGIQAVIGDFLKTDLDNLPRPDAIFIGGHGGQLSEMMERANRYLLKGGCMVINSVTEASHKTFTEAATTLGLTLAPKERITLNDYNPITILKATK